MELEGSLQLLKTV